MLIVIPDAGHNQLHKQKEIKQLFNLFHVMATVTWIYFKKTKIHNCHISYQNWIKTNKKVFYPCQRNYRLRQLSEKVIKVLTNNSNKRINNILMNEQSIHSNRYSLLIFSTLLINQFEIDWHWLEIDKDSR